MDNPNFLTSSVNYYEGTRDYDDCPEMPNGGRIIYTYDKNGGKALFKTGGSTSKDSTPQNKGKPPSFEAPLTAHEADLNLTGEGDP